MGAVPGWYDAGVSGRLRWWDGAQWTEHEADVTVAPQVADGPPPMGWYPTPAGLLRWWDGSKWTGLRVKNGVPGTDWATSEQPSVAWVFGSVFAVLALAQFSLALLTPGPAISGVSMLLLAVLWFAIAAQSSAVRRIPAPTNPAVVIDAVLPLPGIAEAAGAGWYAVGPRTSRWWTGSRWSQYVATAFGVRPTFHGARAWRTLRIMNTVLLGIGVLALVIGIVLLVVGAEPADSLLTVIGVFLLIAGIVLAGVAALMFALSGRQRRVLLLPAGAPSGPPLG